MAGGHLPAAAKKTLPSGQPLWHTDPAILREAAVRGFLVDGMLGRLAR